MREAHVPWLALRLKLKYSTMEKYLFKIENDIGLFLHIIRWFFAVELEWKSSVRTADTW